jgi:hypothetical protein
MPLTRSQSTSPKYIHMYMQNTLKVPKCEIFDLFDFNDFYVIKSL